MRATPQAEILSRGLDDLIQVSEIAWVSRCFLNPDAPTHVDEASVRIMVVDVIRELLELGYAMFGYTVVSDGVLEVSPWESSPSQTAQRIDREWRALDREPSLGEIGWLELTDDGRAAAESVEP